MKTYNQKLCLYLLTAYHEKQLQKQMTPTDIYFPHLNEVAKKAIEKSLWHQLCGSKEILWATELVKPVLKSCDFK